MFFFCAWGSFFSKRSSENSYFLLFDLWAMWWRWCTTPGEFIVVIIEQTYSEDHDHLCTMGPKLIAHTHFYYLEINSQIAQDIFYTGLPGIEKLLAS